MKSAFLLLGLLCSAYLQAQDTPWKGIVGGAFSYSSQSYRSKDYLGKTFSSGTTYQTSLSPYFAYRIKAQWAIGAKGAIDFNRISGYNTFQLQEYDYSFITLNLGLFSRWYFTPDKPLQFFLEPSLNYHRDLDKVNSTDSVKEFNAAIAPGIAWSISKRFNLVARFGQLIYAKGIRELSGRLGDFAYPYHYLNLRLNTATFLLGAELKL